jgi:oxygen-dependent protoporphyrinogen oxidase
VRDVVVVGGGIAGLTAVHRLQRGEQREAGDRVRCRLVEGAARLGGKILTERAGGFLVEGGPDSFLPQKPEALALVRELGLGDRLLASDDRRARTFVLRNGKLVPLPAGLQLLVPTRLRSFLASPLLSWPGKVRLLAERFVPPRRVGDGGNADESVADFVRRRFGAEALERLGEPLLGHIHVADVERMSLHATYPRLAELERRFGSLHRGMRQAALAGRGPATTPVLRRPGGDEGEGRRPAFYTLEGGVGELADALARRLDPDSVLLGRRAVAVTPRPTEGGDPGWTVHLDDGEELPARSVVLALPAFVAAELLAGAEPELARRLRAIPYVSVATLSLGYRRRDLPRPLDGFGFFVPRGEGPRILACTWTSTKFPGRAPEDGALVRVFLGGALQEEVLELDDDALIAAVRADLRPILGVDAEPEVARLHRWPRGYPQYRVGHLERVAEIEAALPPGLHLAGSAYRGVGLPDCIRGGYRAAEEVLAIPRVG